jgi:hypothetical protein
MRRLRVLLAGGMLIALTTAPAGAGMKQAWLGVKGAT